MKIKSRIAAVVMAAVIAFASVLCTSVTADAAFLDNFSSLNNSQISDNVVTTGETVTLSAMPKGVPVSKCTYAYYVRFEDESWVTLKDFSKSFVYQWTPMRAGKYKICIKVKWGIIVDKKYFDVVAAEPLENLSYTSAPMISTGSSVTFYGKASGGLKAYEYAYYVKNSDNDSNWTTLSDFSSADSLQWNPQDEGSYEICIKVRDSIGNIEKKYSVLYVYEYRRTPSSFTLTVKAPLSAPYQWEYKTDDDSVIAFDSVDQRMGSDMIDPAVLLTYKFRTVGAGNTDLSFTYTAYNGTVYTIKYNITVDRNLNYTVNSKSGKYFTAELPEPEQITGSFSIKLDKAPFGYTWNAEVSEPTSVELAKAQHISDDEDRYIFRTMRSGMTTLTMSCISNSNTKVKYRIVYGIEITEDLKAAVLTSDGSYIEGEEIPELSSAG